MLRVLCLTVAYWVSGWLCLQLAIPPGYVTGLFLPLGIGLAAMLIWGNHLLFGVLLGSSLLNISVALVGAQTLTIPVVTLALLIASSSAFACFCGVWLVRRYVGFPNELTSGRDILWLFLLGGAATALISATAGTAVLWWQGVINSHQIVFSWATWWVGDALGVLIAVPLMCVFFAEPRYLWRNRRATLAVPVIFSCLAMVVVFIIASNNEHKKVEVKFAQEASLITGAVRSSLLSVEQTLATLAGLFVASQDVSRDEFAIYVEQIVAKKQGISGFSWNIELTANERGSFEAAMRAQGFDNFVIRERTASGEAIVAPPRANYVVITYIEPWQEGQAIHGFNVAADPVRAQAITRANSSGQFAMTQPLQLLQDKVSAPAVIAFYPVTPLGKMNSLEVSNSPYVMGYATAIVRTNQLINASLQQLPVANRVSRSLISNSINPLQHYTLSITDVTQPDAPLHFYHQGQTVVPTDAEHLVLTEKLNIGGRRLELQVTPTDAFLQTQHGLQSWFVLVGGLLFCSLLGGFLLLISGRTQQIHNLVEQRTRELAAILENAVEAILVVNSNGKIEKANPAAARLFGYSLAHLYRLELTDLLPSVADNIGVNHLLDASREQLARRSDGSNLTVELSISPVDLAERQMFSLIIHDVTERKKVEQLKAEFISTVSHELRTPLTSIKGGLRLVLSGELGVINEKIHSMLKIAANNTDRLSRLVNDILDIDRLELGRVELSLQLQPLFPLLKQAVEQHISYADRYAVRLYLVEPDPALQEVKVKLDADRFLQVMSNLISNAIKFSPRDSQVSIHVMPVEQGIEIAVKDEGQGIPAAFRQRIFSRFAQVDSSDSRHRDGSGLGLSITKVLVERMGGSIRYESEENRGTCFFVRLSCLWP